MDALLEDGELPAVSIREGRGPFVVVCEHASNLLPRGLGTLGLSAADLDRHIAWDPGAAPIAASLVDRIGGDLVLQRYSRLAIDCNRSPEMADAIASRSEDTAIPGNTGLDEAQRGSRVAAIWRPFHDALERLIDRRLASGRATALVTVHTFTRVYRGNARPWHVGIISSGERSFADPVLAALRREPGLVVGDNEPYSPKDNVDYTIRRHGFDRGIPHVMVEVRNDLAVGADAEREWSDRMARAIGTFDVAAQAA